ncbi:hypothetical protein EJB05_14510, partial [Eragrostis curvula]
MRQLPHRSPAAVHHWPEGRHECTEASVWADDFAEFAASRRGAHRRSLSCSVPFLEVASDRLNRFSTAGALISLGLATTGAWSSTASSEEHKELYSGVPVKHGRPCGCRLPPLKALRHIRRSTPEDAGSLMTRRMHLI